MCYQPLVSIILPTYNGEHYLDQAICSCIDQTYNNWELIIVDDASTDNTPDIIEPFRLRDPRIQLIRHEKNKRLPAALNSGFSVSKGNYLTWTSDDNQYRRDALSEMVSFLENNPETAMVYTDYSIIDSQGEFQQYARVNEPIDLLQYNPIGPCFLYKRAVYEMIGEYDEQLFLAEDYDYWLKVSNHFIMKSFHRDLYIYRNHDKSLTALREHEIKQVAEKVLTAHLPRLVWPGKLGLARAYLLLSIAARSNHRRITGLNYLIHAVSYSPVYVITFLLKYYLGKIKSKVISLYR